MKIVYNNLLPFKGFVGIYIFGILFVRNEYNGRLNNNFFNHEAIHDKQAKQLIFIFFYIWYIIEYLIKLFIYGFNTNKAYKNISFEREAYQNMNNLEYIKGMKYLSFLKYLKK